MKTYKKMTALFLLLGGFFLALNSSAELKTVPFVDLGKYAGTLYQIAHIPLFFEGGNCSCARQVLSPGKDGTLDVFNSCNAGGPNGKLKTISGSATNDDPKSNAKFTVDFHLAFKGTYWIIALDKDYRYAVVSDKKQYSLYILSKTPSLSDDLYKEAMTLAAQQLDTSKVEKTEQVGCKYP
jgi:apolipoprotein D and lipocalin family protein